MYKQTLAPKAHARNLHDASHNRWRNHAGKSQFS